MTLEEFIAALGQKIDSEDKFWAIVTPRLSRAWSRARALRDDYFAATALSDGLHSPRGLVERLSYDTPFDFDTPTWGNDCRLEAQHFWWVAREYARCALQVYARPSELLIQHFPIWMAAHQSKEDPSLVAYTPDAAAGMRDAQVRIAFGRLLRKTHPHRSDAWVAAAEASYRADLSDEVELITDAEGLVKAYREGPDSCMSHSPSHFDLPNDLHPVMAYAGAPGVALAVLRDANGRVNARCLVFNNPDDPADKRYLRHYGDNRLRKRLEKQGYQCKSFVGVRLRAIPHPTRSGVYVAPYLDSAGGRNGGEAFVLDGDHLRIVDNAEMLALSRAMLNLQLDSRTGYAAHACRTDGAYALKPLPSMERTCPLTGRQYDALKVGATYPVWVEESGTIAVTPFRPDDYTLTATARVEDRWCEVHIREQTPTFFSYGLRIVDTDEAREASNQVRLSERFYPDLPRSERWVGDGTIFTHDDEIIRRADAVHLIVMVDGTPVLRTVHRSELPPKGAKSISRIQRAVPCYAMKDVPLVRLESGYWAVQGVHYVAQTWDGKWLRENQTVYSNLYGFVVRAEKGRNDWRAAGASEAFKAYWKTKAPAALGVAMQRSATRPTRENVDRMAVAVALVWVGVLRNPAGHSVYRSPTNTLDEFIAGEEQHGGAPDNADSVARLVVLRALAEARDQLVAGYEASQLPTRPAQEPAPAAETTPARSFSASLDSRFALVA